MAHYVDNATLTSRKLHHSRGRDPEKKLLERAIELLGTADALYVSTDGNSVHGDALPHHGLLLREERKLHESLYRRANGVPVMVATSTVAQGMNFPSELVIIAGDRRFDSNTNQLERLQAHELLNAAGRAGRAGQHSNGLVVVIPSFPVTYDGQTRMGRGWFQLQSVFSQSDQCVTVVDPIGSVLDQLDSEEGAELSAYFLRRVASSEGIANATAVASRSLGALFAARDGHGYWLDDRLRMLEAAVSSIDFEPWVQKVVAMTGLPAEDILFVAGRLDAVGVEVSTIAEWREWFVEVLGDRPSLLEAVLRVGSRAAFRGAPEELTEWAIEGNRLVTEVGVHLSLWVQGATLQEIQSSGIDRRVARANRYLEFARKFVLRVVPDLAYLFGIPYVILKSRSQADDDLTGNPLADLAPSIEAGVDTSQKLAYLRANPVATRAGAHRANGLSP
jgi:hypothetical protein